MSAALALVQAGTGNIPSPVGTGLVPHVSIKF